MKKTMILSMILLTSYIGFSQEGLYESKEIQKAYEKGTRSRDGIPGANYWQNYIEYVLKADLDPTSKLLKGEGTITYINNSPDTLKYMVIKLLPNIHKKGNARDYTVGNEHLNDGMIIDSITINNSAQNMDDHRKFMEYGTNLYVIFEKSERIVPGSVNEYYIRWEYEVINNGIRNGAFTDSAFFIGYWYPQIAVYDDIFGWDREDYTGLQETYNDLGTYDVEITVPEDYVVWATGDQLNETELFSDPILQLINKSRESDETIHILSTDNYASKNIFKTQTDYSWKFKAEKVPDFAWACSNYYNWDANSLILEGDNKKKIWISAVYPPDSKSFNKVADIAHQGIDYLSNVFPGIPYPYDKHVTFNGIHHVAVEYPMMANNSDHPQEEMYTELTVHEIAHNFIPFLMLSNERKDAWIDEGWVKLIGEIHGESLGIKRENKEALNTMNAYEKGAGTSRDLPLMVPSGFMTVRDNYYHSYAKAANANMFLLELMKDKGIENPLKDFIMTWKYKHPSPYDFFNYMNNVGGEDLSWFWKPWYFEFSNPDLEIHKGNIADEILVINKGGIPLPIILTLIYNDETEKVIEESIWIWAEKTDEVAISIPNLDQVKSITLGSPAIPDINDANNTLVLQNEVISEL
jgi:hypothetical protein